MQPRAGERPGRIEVVDDDAQRRPGLLHDATRVGDVARIDRKRPREVGDAGTGEHLGLHERGHREPARPVLELQTAQLDALVGFRVGPQRHAQLPGAPGHPLEIALHDIEVQQERRCLHVVRSYASRIPHPVSL